MEKSKKLCIEKEKCFLVKKIFKKIGYTEKETHNLYLIKEFYPEDNPITKDNLYLFYEEGNLKLNVDFGAPEYNEDAFFEISNDIIYRLYKRKQDFYQKYVLTNYYQNFHSTIKNYDDLYEKEHNAQRIDLCLTIGFFLDQIKVLSKSQKKEFVSHVFTKTIDDNSAYFESSGREKTRPFIKDFIKNLKYTIKDLYKYDNINDLPQILLDLESQPSELAKNILEEEPHNSLKKFYEIEKFIKFSDSNFWTEFLETISNKSNIEYFDLMINISKKIDKKKSQLIILDFILKNEDIIRNKQNSLVNFINDLHTSNSIPDKYLEIWKKCLEKKINKEYLNILIQTAEKLKDKNLICLTIDFFIKDKIFFKTNQDTITNFLSHISELKFSIPQNYLKDWKEFFKKKSSQEDFEIIKEIACHLKNEDFYYLILDFIVENKNLLTINYISIMDLITEISNLKNSIPSQHLNFVNEKFPLVKSKNLKFYYDSGNIHACHNKFDASSENRKTLKDIVTRILKYLTECNDENFYQNTVMTKKYEPYIRYMTRWPSENLDVKEAIKVTTEKDQEEKVHYALISMFNLLSSDLFKEHQNFYTWDVFFKEWKNNKNMYFFLQDLVTRVPIKKIYVSKLFNTMISCDEVNEKDLTRFFEKTKNNLEKGDIIGFYFKIFKDFKKNDISKNFKLLEVVLIYLQDKEFYNETNKMILRKLDCLDNEWIEKFSKIEEGLLTSLKNHDFKSFFDILNKGEFIALKKHQYEKLIREILKLPPSSDTQNALDKFLIFIQDNTNIIIDFRIITEEINETTRYIIKNKLQNFDTTLLMEVLETASIFGEY